MPIRELAGIGDAPIFCWQEAVLSVTSKQGSVPRFLQPHPVQLGLILFKVRSPGDKEFQANY